jgi:hypothetical protein
MLDAQIFKTARGDITEVYRQLVGENYKNVDYLEDEEDIIERHS